MSARLPMGIILRIVRNRTGATSAVEAAVGAVAFLVAVHLATKAGIELDKDEVAYIMAAGPVISSQVLGTIRHVYHDIMTAFQRGTSEPT